MDKQPEQMPASTPIPQQQNNNKILAIALCLIPVITLGLIYLFKPDLLKQYNPLNWFKNANSSNIPEAALNALTQAQAQQAAVNIGAQVNNSISYQLAK